MEKTELLIAEKLLKIGAFKLQPDSPFVWGGGWSSPIYSDNRQALSHPDVRAAIKIELARAVMTYGDVDVVAGVATGAIAMGAIVADVLGVPYVYVRETPKDHGLENRIEGNILPGQRVVIIEDLLITGKACLSAAQAVEEAGGIVTGVVALFNYEFPVAARALRKTKLPVTCVTNYSAMIQTALDAGVIQPEDVKSLKQWHDDPEGWTPGEIELD
ncbi:MAG: orotate phosphoribosyltransferase [Muribaculaceae bacterium]|nr:orotate phosphoribosyltransferase [Muribaculaceae bacterium]